ncbi:MAG: hypothetical protein GY947_01175 [Rhodobacteraceae bacterium]|nr:hypothetical protein [Paracoccaceae bacterium]
MRSIVVGIAGAALLLGCTPPGPNDGAQYFDNLTPDPVELAAQNQRPPSVSTQPVTVRPPQAGATQAPVSTAAADPATQTSSGDISDNQDFGRLKERETIESDAAKLAALKADYKTVDPKAVPRRGNSVNLAAYALQQKNAVGERVYSRFSVGLSNCRKYRSNPDAAQRAFLNAGGPAKDSLNLDPDGDGFACTWNPDTYRRLLQG